MYCTYNSEYYNILKQELGKSIIRRINNTPIQIEVATYDIEVVKLSSEEKYLIGNELDNFVNQLCKGRNRDAINNIRKNIEIASSFIDNLSYRDKLTLSYIERNNTLLRQLVCHRMVSRIKLIKTKTDIIECCNKKDYIWKNNKEIECTNCKKNISW